MGVPRYGANEVMANHPSAKKRIRQTERRTDVNVARRSRVRTYLKTVESAIAAGDKEAASTALKAAQPELHRIVANGIIHRNLAARKISRLSRRINAI